MVKIRDLMAAGLLTALSTALATQAQASTNFALSPTASFVTASSFIDYGAYGLTAINGGQTTAEADLLTASPRVWLNDGDTRYLFSDYDTTSSVTIDLGADRTLTSVGATFFGGGYDDRQPTQFAVEVSTSGQSGTFTPEGSVLTSVPGGGGSDLVNFSAPVKAQYVEYVFGGAGGGPDDGIGVGELFASGVPEPGAWAMMLMGVGGLGAALRRRRKPAAVAA